MEKGVMNSNRFIPPDNEEQKRKAQEGYWGICGPSAIAALTEKSVKDVIDVWGNFKGFSPLKEMEETLRKLGYDVELVRGNKAKTFPQPRTDAAILRIQWLQADGTEFYWRARTPNTHYVLMKKLDDEWWVFCNEVLWFKLDGEVGSRYLTLGYVSSYLEMKKT